MPYSNVSCNQTSVQYCLTECPEVACSVRELRNAVIETSLEHLVELALEEHWNEAFDSGVHQTLFEEREQIQIR